MQGPVYVSAQKLAEMKQELQELKSTTIRHIAQQIDDAKQNGDLSENAEYADAKERMAFAQGRVVELEHAISNAMVIDSAVGKSTVHIGSTIVVEVQGTGETRVYEIVGSSEANPMAGKISNESPLGESFIGHAVGDDVEVVTPVKKTTYKILEIK